MLAPKEEQLWKSEQPRAQLETSLSCGLKSTQMKEHQITIQLLNLYLMLL